MHDNTRCICGAKVHLFSETSKRIAENCTKRGKKFLISQDEMRNFLQD